jgi:hypothetical protein
MEYDNQGEKCHEESSVEYHMNWSVLRDSVTGRLYYQGASPSYAGFGEINQTPLVEKGEVK